MDIILASSSRRRIALMSKLFKDFTINVPPEPNHLKIEMNAKEESLRMAEVKAQWTALRNPGAVVIGADTLVSVDGEKLSKPKNARDAKRQLELISGKKFEVYSSVCICTMRDGKKIRQKLWARKCGIKCESLSKKEITNYLKTKKWIGKAGSFNILEKPTKDWLKAKNMDLNPIAGLDIEGIKKEIKSI